MPIDKQETFRRYRAPANDGETFVDPPLSQLPRVVSANRGLLNDVANDVFGEPLAKLRAGARRGLLQAAIRYTGAYRDTSYADSYVNQADHMPLVLSGHQPQLFHPGVWYKNFVLGSVAEEVGGVGVHLLIDSDLCREVSLRVPTGTTLQPRVESMAYDARTADVPYEERTIEDGPSFASFGVRAKNAISGLIRAPLVETLWPIARERAREERNLGSCVSQARHIVEAQWGNQTIEAPLSAVCQLPEFARFLTHVLVHLPRFHQSHNDALAEYRRAHGLRNRAHPVPDLGQVDDWLEAPFWIWSRDNPRRRAVFARRSPRGIEVSDRGGRTLQLEFPDDGEAEAMVAQLVAAESRGIRIRTRALTTTLFARLILGDLFLHGIGGAKYDQVTDLLARTFFGFELPTYAVVSATLRLPLTGEPVSALDGDAPRMLRELRYHPERFLTGEQVGTPGDAAGLRAIVDEKRRWIHTIKTPENAHRRHLAIVAANQGLQAFVSQQHAELTRRMESERKRRNEEAILRSREYSFCLYPPESFSELLTTTRRMHL